MRMRTLVGQESMQWYVLYLCTRGSGLILCGQKRNPNVGGHFHDNTEDDSLGLNAENNARSRAELDDEQDTEEDHDQRLADPDADSDADRNYKTLESDSAEDTSDSEEEEDDRQQVVNKENHNPNRAAVSAMRHTMREAMGAIGSVLKSTKKSSNNGIINANDYTGV